MRAFSILGKTQACFKIAFPVAAFVPLHYHGQMCFEFSWDSRKAVAKLRKHAVSFGEASTIFDDPLAITYPDIEHSTGETRYVTFGVSSSFRTLK